MSHKLNITINIRVQVEFWRQFLDKKISVDLYMNVLRLKQKQWAVIDFTS